MGISDKIEAFITELLKEGDSYAEFGRNELAGIFGCVPSQINYVISTRFGQDKGYMVESRRGGGGYIRISRLPKGNSFKVVAEIGGECDYETAKMIIKQIFDVGGLEGQSAKILLNAVSDRALSLCENKNKVRAAILKNALEEL